MPVSSAKQTRKRLGILFSLPLFFCIVFFLFQLFTDSTNNRLTAIKRLETSVNTLRSLAKDAESSELGFLLTGDEVFLTAFRQAQITFKQMQLKVGTTERDFQKLQKNVDEIAALVKVRLDETAAIVARQKKNGFAPAIEAAKADGTDETMTSLRGKSIDLLRDLDAREQQALGNQQRLSYLAFSFFSLGTVMMIAVMYWLYNEVLSYIDARDQAQEQLETFNADLQTMVDERTRDLTEANRELQQFAYVASHDLQEPLRTITSFSQLLASRYKGRLEADADEFIGYIVTASKRMTDLINGLLQIVRLRKPGQPTVRIPFHKLLDDAEASLQAAIRQNAVRVERTAMPELLVDRVQMLQVLQNLMANAIKYRGVEPPLIRISASRSSADWQISVADNGCGFGQEYAERIFGLFQRLQGRDVEGTGMGLYIARRIVERHGGRIWAESKEGVGSTFFFTLPVALEVGKPAAHTSLGEPTKSGLTPRPGKARGFSQLG